MTVKKKAPKGKSGLENSQVEINPEIKKPPATNTNTVVSEENRLAALIRKRYIADI